MYVHVDVFKLFCLICRNFQLSLEELKKKFFIFNEKYNEYSGIKLLHLSSIQC